MTTVFEMDDVDQLLKEYYPGFDVDAHYPRTSFDDYVVQLTIKDPLAAPRMEESVTEVVKCNAPRKTYRVKRTCVNCAEAKTPQWRQGPDGPLTLCNACGVAYAKHDNDGLRVRREKMRYML